MYWIANKSVIEFPVGQIEPICPIVGESFVIQASHAPMIAQQHGSLFLLPVSSFTEKVSFLGSNTLTSSQLLIVSFSCWHLRYRAAVDHRLHDCEVLGSNPAGCWGTIFISLSIKWCALEPVLYQGVTSKISVLMSAQGCSFSYLLIVEERILHLFVAKARKAGTSNGKK